MDRIYQKLEPLSVGYADYGNSPFKPPIINEFRVPCTPVQSDLPVLRGMELRGVIFGWITDVAVRACPPEDGEDMSAIVVYGVVPNRDDPTEKIPLTTMKYIHTRDVTRRAVRDVILGMITHEMDECIYVDEERIFDPHAVRHFKVKL
jgi:hypothetical protein